MRLQRLAKKSGLFMALLLAAPQFALAYGEASEVQKYVGRQAEVPMIKPPWANFLIHTDKLNQIYSLRNYQPIWIDQNGNPTQLTTALKNLFKAADTHGLNPSDYWDNEIDRIFNVTLTKKENWITFEMMATEALIRYSSHLQKGRFEPNEVDTDIKYKLKSFTDYSMIEDAIEAGPQGFAAAMERLAPLSARYKDLKEALVQLKNIRGQGGWAPVKATGSKLKRGVKSPLVSQLRSRLNQIGYPVGMAGGDTFDQEFEDALKNFQLLNGIAVDGEVGSTQSSEVLRVLNYSVNSRISQVEMTMEKLRWLPRQLESSYIFVNLAMSDFRLYENNGDEVFFFKTIAGQPFRRTPSMKDSLTYVDLNPTWGVPRNLAIKDKLPALKADPDYLGKHKMRLYDMATDREVNPRRIDWQSMTPKDFNYYIQQDAGLDNALGVVKFPLQNPWAIYMHDTNEKYLFEKNDRHFSSGCVLLNYVPEEPFSKEQFL